MLIASIKRYLKGKKKGSRRADPVVLATTPRRPATEPEILWSREKRPQDLGTLKHELGAD